MTSLHKLPNNKYTTSQTRYLREWGKYCRRLEKIFIDYHTIGYDPGILLGNTTGTRSFNLLVSECDLIFQAIDKKKT